MTYLSADCADATLALSRSDRAGGRRTMRATASSVVRAGAVLLALASLTVPDAVLHAKWFKFGLILDTASRHYTAQS